MYYITLDLEWNQAYAQKAMAVQRQLACRLRGEVIQIGAVKLDEELVPCGSYQIIIKPKFFKRLHKHVSALTHITQEQMDSGTPLPEAIERFHSWCGDDFAFLTWGPDDIPMLKENLNAHRLPSEWLDRTYDLQSIFNRQTDGLSKQRSLEYAMEYFSISQTLPAHDALNDAYFTALVAARLNVAEGIRTYSAGSEHYLHTAVIGDADAGDDGYVTVNEILTDDTVIRHACPLCGAALAPQGKALHAKGQRYTLPLRCPQDGDMLLTLRVHRNFNDTFRAKLTLELATEEKLATYRAGLEGEAARRKASRRRRSHRKPREAVSATDPS